MYHTKPGLYEYRNTAGIYQLRLSDKKGVGYPYVYTKHPRPNYVGLSGVLGNGLCTEWRRLVDDTFDIDGIE